MAGGEYLNQRPAPEEIRSWLREFLAARGEVDWAYLFGSFLDGTDYHDIDVGLYLRPHSRMTRFSNTRWIFRPGLHWRCTRWWTCMCSTTL